MCKLRFTCQQFCKGDRTGLGVAWWFGPVLVFGIIPLLDLVIGKDSVNPPDSAIKWLEQDRYYRWCTYLFLPIQFASLIFACSVWSSGQRDFVPAEEGVPAQ